MPPNAIKMHVMHTKRKVKSILLFFPLILNHSVRSDYIPKKTVTCNNLRNVMLTVSKGAYATNLA